MKATTFVLVFTALICMSKVATATCYRVYDPANKLVYSAQQSPVDMSRPVHETLPSIFPGGHLVFTLNDDSCPKEDQISVRASSEVAAGNLVARQSTPSVLDNFGNTARNGEVPAGNSADTLQPYEAAVHARIYRRASGIPKGAFVAPLTPSTGTLNLGAAPPRNHSNANSGGGGRRR